MTETSGITRWFKPVPMSHYWLVPEKQAFGSRPIFAIGQAHKNQCFRLTKITAWLCRAGARLKPPPA